MSSSTTPSASTARAAAPSRSGRSIRAFPLWLREPLTERRSTSRFDRDGPHRRRLRRSVDAPSRSHGVPRRPRRAGRRRPPTQPPGPSASRPRPFNGSGCRTRSRAVVRSRGRRPADDADREERHRPRSGISAADAQTYASGPAAGSPPRVFLGPTLHVQPGDTVEMTLDNRLDVPDDVAPAPSAPPRARPTSSARASGGRRRRRSSRTSHFHGLHVTPRDRKPTASLRRQRPRHLPDGQSHVRFGSRATTTRARSGTTRTGTSCTDDQVYRGLAGLLIDRRLAQGPARALPRRRRRGSLALKDVQVGAEPAAAACQIVRPTTTG